MSGLLYPVLPGLTYEVLRTYPWNTGLQEAQSGVQSAIAFRAYGKAHFELVYSALREPGAPGYVLTTSEIKALVGLHNAMRGRADTFLFTDPEFNTIASSSPQAFGISDGTTSTRYQLVAFYQNPGGPGSAELVQNLNGTAVIYDNGSAISATHYSLDALGGITFSISPTTGHTLSWSGSFYYRCRFDEDEIDWTKFMNALWKAKKVAFTAVILPTP